MAAPHPLQVLAPAVLTALLHVAVVESESAHRRLQTRLEAFVRAKRGAIAYRVTETTRRGGTGSGPDALVPWLVAHGMTLAMLLEPAATGGGGGGFTLAELGATLGQDLAALLGAHGGEWKALAGLAALGAPPHALRQALGLKKRGALGTLLGTPVDGGTKAQRAWLEHRDAFGPRDLAALGVPLGDWLAASPTLLQAAAAGGGKGEWWSRASADEWNKYAGVTATQFAALTGQPPLPPAAAATPTNSSNVAGPSASMPSTWI